MEDGAKLKILRRTRGGHKSYATVLRTECQKLLEYRDLNDAEKEDWQNKLLTNRTILEEKLGEIKRLDDEIATLIEDDEEFNKEMIATGNYRKEILNICIAVGRRLDASEPDKQETKQQIVPKVNNSNTRLEKLKLPHFDGDPLKFQSFWDSFGSAVNKDDSLDDISKFNYLRGVLKGKAAAVIEGLAGTSENYHQALELLEKRFGDQQVIIAAHCDALTHMSPASIDDIKELRQLCDNIEIHTRNLQQFDICANNYGPLLVSIIQSKLPGEIKLEISRNMPDGKWDIGQFLDAMKKEISARERCSTDETNRHEEVEIKFKGSSSNLLTQGTVSRQGKQRSHKNKKQNCAFCEKPHSTNLCRTFKTVEERKNAIQQKNKCYRCFGSNHVARQCYSKRLCAKCQGKHHDLICSETNNEATNNEADRDDANRDENNVIVNNLANDTVCNYILLQTARADIINCTSDNMASARLIFDNCSQRSFITKALSEALKLKSDRQELLNVKTFATDNDNVKSLDIVKIRVRSKFDKKVVVDMEAFVVPMICAPVTNQVIDIAKRNNSMLRSVELADAGDASTEKKVDILVGADYYWKIVIGTIIRNDDGLTAVETKIGWVLNGPVKTKPIQSHTVNLNASHVIKVGVEKMPTKDEFERFWEVEDDTSELNEFDSEEFMKKISFNGERYEVPLPWKPGMKEKLPRNFYQSEKRLNSQYHRLKDKDENRNLKRYDDVIKEWEAEGIIEKCDDDPEEAHHLPTQHVIKENRETTQFRVVCDGSSNNPSLNDCLEKGENLVPLMVPVLLQFRIHKVALTSDIKKAFLNVAVRKEDRNFLRILWYDDVFSPNPKITVYRFSRVLFGLNSSSYLLSASIKKHLMKYNEEDPSFVEYLERCLYVDDHVGGADDAENAVDLYRKLKGIFLEAGLEMRKWCTNDASLQKKINQLEKVNNGNNQAETKKESCQVLGVEWNTTLDQFHIKTSEISRVGREIKMSKRNVLKTIASIFDPLGVLAFIIIRFKAFFQKLSQMKIGWDKELPTELHVEWLKLIELLENDNVFIMDRYYFGKSKLKEIRHFTLHGFCDASKLGYAAVIYLVGENGKKKQSNFVVAKTKIAPLRGLSIPKLELCSCLLLAQAMHTVVTTLSSHLKNIEVVCWNDSLDALQWIKNEKRREVFVRNRVVKIREMVAAENWRYCPTKLNAADIASRGVTKISKIPEEYKKWMKGPQFMLNRETWPPDRTVIGTFENIENVEKIVNCNIEVENEVICMNITNPVTDKKELKILVTQSSGRLEEIINVTKFSCVQKLLRVTAWVLRFTNNARCKGRGKLAKTGYLKLLEVQKAEIMWIKSMQKELKYNSKQLNNTLGLLLDEKGLILCKGRLGNADLTQNQINPILIPGKTHFAKLLARDAHLTTNHGGKKDTITELRSKYWVTKIRSLVRQVLHECARPCKRLESKAYKSCTSSQLPSFRVRQSFPFANTGVDYLGPLLVWQVFDKSNTSMYKVWVVLYTCAVTRAIHLDLVPDPSAGAFIRSLKRFIGRRGIPNLMISDNATCFRNEEVKLNEDLLQMKVKWKFIVESSPWWGGFWERLVQTVKRSLRKVLLNASVNYEELLTIVIETEGIVNSRPLSYMYDDDVEEILTPSHLLLGRRLLSRFEEEFDNGENVDNKVLTKRMKYLKLLNTRFWNRFKDEYLLELRNQHIQGQEPKKIPEIGEVVVIEGKEKRNNWRLGKIVSFIEGSDGKNRAVVLKTIDRGKGQFLKRPIERLYPLEIKSNSKVTNDEIEMARGFISNQNISNEEGPKSRPVRAAATKGLMQRRLAETKN